MLGKVLKYDLKALCRYLIPLYAVLFGLGIMIRLLGFFDNVSIIAIIVNNPLNSRLRLRYFIA